MSNKGKKTKSENVKQFIEILDGLENIHVTILDEKLVLDVGYIEEIRSPIGCMRCIPLALGFLISASIGYAFISSPG